MTSRYAAFVSYRHLAEDRRWARRLQAALEGYRVPRSLVGLGHSQRLGKVFRDDDEIPAAGSLTHQIEDALDASRILVVICSPDTPKSEWVRREIRHFQASGKSDRIFPVLIAGTPEQSFPEELRFGQIVETLASGQTQTRSIEIEPIGADVKPRDDEPERKTFERALLRLAAGILGCGFDDLYQRERRRQRVRLGSLAAVLVCLALVALAAWDQQWRIHTQYCVNVAERYLVPQCVGPISSKVAGQRPASYRFRTQAGAVIELARVNAADWPTESADNDYEDDPVSQGTAIWHYSPLRDGRFTVEHQSATGKHLRTVSVELSADRRQALLRFDVAFGVSERQRAGSSALALLGDPTNTGRTSIGQHRLRLDERGYIASRHFEPIGGGVAIADDQGSHGQLYQRGAQGLAIRVSNLDALGAPLVEKTGVAAMERSYDAQGSLQEVRWTDALGELIENSEGFARCRYTLDPRLRWTSYELQDRRGELTLHRSKGLARFVREFDARGKEIAAAYFNTHGQPVLRKDLVVARTTYENDERANTTAEAYFGLRGEPILRKDLGAARITWEYDERGNTTAEAYFGTDGRPILRKDVGAARITWDYDERGNSIVAAYFGTDGQPVLRKDWGTARITWEYDERGNATAAAFWGIDSRSILRIDIGAARITWEYDERGNSTAAAYFGTGGQPVLCKDWGAAQITFAYDERGNNIAWAYFGTNGQPILPKEMGAARTTFDFDERGNLIAQAYYGVDGQPILSAVVGVARITHDHDERGNTTASAYFDADGQPILRKEWGAARITKEYDERGNATAESYFGTDGHRILRKDLSAARITREYDERGNATAESYFGADGQPILRKDLSAARITWEYDDRGNNLTTANITEAYFGTDGQRILRKDIGSALTGTEYDERGNATAESYFGTDGQPILRKDAGAARITWGYDERGNNITESYFGTDGQPIAHRETGAVIERYEYDAADELVRTRRFDVKGHEIAVAAEGTPAREH